MSGNQNPFSTSTIDEVELLGEHWNQNKQHQLDGKKASQNMAAHMSARMAKGFDRCSDWYLNQLPPLYHEITPDHVKDDHLVDICMGHLIENQETIERYNTTHKVYTIMSAGDQSTTAKIASFLSKRSGKFVNILLSSDKKAAVCTLYKSDYIPVKSWDTANLKQKHDHIHQQLRHADPQGLEQYLSLLDSEYAANATPSMIALGYEAFTYCQTHESSYVKLNIVNTDKDDKQIIRVDIGLKSVPLCSANQYISALFSLYGFNISRVLANEIRDINEQQLTVLNVTASHTSPQKITADLIDWNRLLKALKTLSYVDHNDEFTALLEMTNPFSINETNLVRAMANWSHIFQSKINPHYYSLDRVSKILLKYDSLLRDMIVYFRCKFDPKFKGDRTEDAKNIAQKIDGFIFEIPEEIERNSLKEAFRFIQNILKTNYFLISKGALTFRVSPDILNPTYYPEKPYGIFYMIGRDFRAFQVRYRDIARGGVRVVLPATMGDYDSTLAGLFDEVNGLAYAQQLKNKDIPEGGSKCVFVVRPGGNRHRAVKGGIAGLLDLIVTDPQSGKLHESIHDYWGREEVIYLGPDENMTNDLINWTVQHANRRGYKYANAFMSSKPDFGINHKTYGVTSEGLNVYLDHVLRYLNLSKPDSHFRVKMTGGPDGDVAGNELKILYREYSKRAQVVAIADGFGAAFDPKGLHWPELLRLVEEGKSIVEFSAKHLSSSKDSFVIKADTREHTKIRDNLYATAEAEIFVPAGGRPYTVKESNWSRYLLADGRPSSLAIVEGANIFFTPEARKKLVESGIIVIKDSSANKTGVICSSYEIIACLTLSPSEFAEIKTTYVDQVIDILRQKAGMEAKLLFNEWQKRKTETDLVTLSYEISKEINKGKDIVTEHLNHLSDAQLNSEKNLEIIYLHCPNILIQKYKNRIAERLPRAHKIAIIAAFTASQLIYHEGLNWIDTMEPSAIFNVSLNYVSAERLVEKMLAEVANSSIPNKDKVIDILKSAGPKYLAGSHHLN